MTIAPVINIEREQMGPLGILMRIDDGVYVCNFSVYSFFFNHTKHAYVYDIFFSTKEKSASCGEIIDNITYALICVLKEKDISNKDTLKNIFRKFFDGNFIVWYAFKGFANGFP